MKTFSFLKTVNDPMTDYLNNWVHIKTDQSVKSKKI